MSELNEDYYYSIVYDELKSGKRENACMTKAVAKSGGDSNLANSLYIEYRFRQLIQQAQEREDSEIAAVNQLVNLRIEQLIQQAEEEEEEEELICSSDDLIVRISQMEDADNKGLGCLVIMLLGAFFYTVHKIEQYVTINNPIFFEKQPYPAILDFYYYYLGVPVMSVGTLYTWVCEGNLTSFKNLNFCLAVAGSATWLLVLIGVYWVIGKVVVRVTKIELLRYTYVTLPFIFGGIWFFAYAIFSWLFA